MSSIHKQVTQIVREKFLPLMDSRTPRPSKMSEQAWIDGQCRLRRFVHSDHLHKLLKSGWSATDLFRVTAEAPWYEQGLLAHILKGHIVKVYPDRVLLQPSCGDDYYLVLTKAPPEAQFIWNCLVNESQANHLGAGQSIPHPRRARAKASQTARNVKHVTDRRSRLERLNLPGCPVKCFWNPKTNEIEIDLTNVWAMR